MELAVRVRVLARGARRKERTAESARGFRRCGNLSGHRYKRAGERGFRRDRGGFVWMGGGVLGLQDEERRRRDRARRGRARPRLVRSSPFTLRTKLALGRGARPLTRAEGARSVRLNFCSREEFCGRVHGDGAHPCAARCSSPRARLPGMLLSPILAAASVLFLFLHRPLIN